MGIKEWSLIALSIIGGILWVIGEFVINNFGMSLAGAIMAIIPFVILIALFFIKNNRNNTNRRKKDN